MNHGLPHQEGPLVPDDNGSLADEAAAFLQGSDRDVEDAVASSDVRDTSLASFRTWIDSKLAELDADPDIDDPET
jgi:hypothetical protein